MAQLQLETLGSPKQLYFIPTYQQMLTLNTPQVFTHPLSVTAKNFILQTHD
jgi:hypothetical protein